MDESPGLGRVRCGVKDDASPCHTTKTQTVQAGDPCAEPIEPAARTLLGHVDRVSSSIHCRYGGLPSTKGMATISGRS